MDAPKGSEEQGIAGVDLNRLGNWMDQQGLPSGPFERVEQLTGGTQNILLRFRRGGQEYVLRRPPLHPRPHSNKIMAREARLLGALAGSDVPHPALIASCDDENILGAFFYLMAPVDGFNPTVAMSPQASASPQVRHKMGIGLAEGLAALAGVDHEASGLADFGKIDGFLQRQVGRWAGELEGYTQFAQWSGPAPLGDVASIGRWLEANCPTELQPGIIHGDYHIGNLIYSDDGELKAIVDWEMATLGDPLIDLGRLLLSWPDGPARPYHMRVTPTDGFPSRAEMIAIYADRTGRDLKSLPWFEVLSCYKLGIIFEGTHARSQAGLADRGSGDRLHASAIALLDHARGVLRTLT